MKRLTIPHMDATATPDQMEKALRAVIEYLQFESQTPGPFWAEITGSTGSDQFTYTFQQVRQNGDGYGGFTAVSSGFSGTAYNGYEVGDTFSAAVPTGAVVRMHVVRTSPRAKQFWFSTFNANAT